MATTPTQPDSQPPAPANASTDADTTDTTDHDRPVRILVQTKTHLVPGEKSTGFMQRVDSMVNLICHHVWQRDYDLRRERKWMHGGEFSIDNRPVWFLVDHHGPDAVLVPDPPVVWYTWTGTDFIMVQDPLPRRVRREVQQYPFKRLTAEQLKPPPKIWDEEPRKFASDEQKMRHRREDLRSTLACGLSLFEDHVDFVRGHPKHAAWVKARVPPEAWARLDDPSEIVQMTELSEEEIREALYLEAD